MKGIDYRSKLSKSKGKLKKRKQDYKSWLRKNRESLIKKDRNLPNLKNKRD